MNTAIIKMSGWRAEKIGAVFFRSVKGVERRVRILRVVERVERPGGLWPMCKIEVELLN